MRRLIVAIGSQTYAFTLAFVHMLNGVRTDEAKYLLNIPYPHPPLVRTLLGFFDGWQWQEYGARLLFATLMAHAVWIVWDMGRSLRVSVRCALCVLWLGSAAFVLQAGTVMMAPITALQALLFLWILSLPRQRLPSSATIGLLWIVTLFSALQGALLLPLAVAALRLRGASWKAVAWYAGAPIVLLALYALGNPLVLASFGLQAGKDAGSTLVERGQGALWILVLAGSGIGSIVGIAGLLLKRHWMILASFALFAAYVFLGKFDYYAIFFLPFFITGAKHLFRRVPFLGIPTGILLPIGTVALLVFYVPLLSPRSSARSVLNQFDTGVILLKGSFGHEWQYEAAPGQELRRYSAGLTSQADVAVCFDDCRDLEERGWVESDGGLVHTWRKR